MADSSKAIEAITESRPPATDRFTYLTIVGEYASPEILPTLYDILQDPQLTQEIGWDLVQILLPIPGSEACLETIARLGNPREVILAVLAALASSRQPNEDDDEEEQDEEDEYPDEDGEYGTQDPTATCAEDAHAPEHFVTLLGMLAILHKRLKVKRPSRFLASTVQTVLQAYNPAHPQMTAAVINLVHSLSGRRRPPLPTRKSSVSISGVLNPDRDGDASKNAPDPEADEQDGTPSADEDAIQSRLLLSFVTCVLETYVNGNPLSWAARLVEFYGPDKVVPHRQTVLQAFREDEELQSRDAIVGQLAALIKDLGLSSGTKEFLQDVGDGYVHGNPLSGADDGVAKADDVRLSSGGSACLLAYWLFSTAVFGADNPKPDIFALPQHFTLLEGFLDGDAQTRIETNPGTTDSIVAIGLWLVHAGRVLPHQGEAVTSFMNYHHLLTLNAVYHPSAEVRNAATNLAGSILHADPDAQDRLKILDDLLENCTFASLMACAVTWLREELVLAATSEKSGAEAGSTPFSGPEALDALQYAVFPNVASLRDMDGSSLLEWWTQNSPFVLQTVNFALFLFSNGGAYKHAVPGGMGTAVETRYLDPLAAVAKTLEGYVKTEGKAPAGQNDPSVRLALEVEVLQDRLKQLSLTERFGSLTVGATGAAGHPKGTGT